MFALPISMHVLKALFFSKYLQNYVILQKKENFLCAGRSASRPRTFSNWGLCAQTPSLWRMEASPPGPQNSSSHCEFLAKAWCFYWCYDILFKLILRLDVVCGFPQVALSLITFGHPCTISLQNYALFL